ncbi:hypothetical protein [Mycobacterium sp. URHB0021]
MTGPDTAVEFAANHLGAREGLTEGDRFALEAGKAGGRAGCQLHR